MRKTCPRCGSDSRAKPCPVATAGTFGNYTCRDAWHMPAHTDEAAAALEFCAEVDKLASGDVFFPDYSERGLARQIRNPGSYQP